MVLLIGTYTLVFYAYIVRTANHETVFFLRKNDNDNVWDSMQWMVPLKKISNAPCTSTKTVQKSISLKKKIFLWNIEREVKRNNKKARVSNIEGKYETLLFFWECTENCLNQIGERLR